MLKVFFPLLMIFFHQSLVGQPAETLLLRNPTVSDKHLAFVYGGDIWLAEKDGSHPRRLTVNPTVEQLPVFSPDGSKIAFTGNYDGNTDVYVISINGGEPQRVTSHPAADLLRGWLSDEEVYFTTQREFTYSLGSRLYRSKLDGSVDYPLLMPEAYQGSPSPDGRYWAYLKNADPTERDRVAFKRYRGGGMPSIWIFDTKTHDIEVVPGEKSNDVKPIWMGNKVYFLSDRDKIVNVFSYDVESKVIEKLTHHDDYDVRTLQGNRGELVYEQAGRIHYLDLDSKTSQPVAIHLAADAVYKRPHYVDMKDAIRNAGISPTGKRALFESRGEIFTVPKEKGDARNISKETGSHERFPAWSPDGRWISYLSDKNGRFELVLRDQKGVEEPQYFSLGTTESHYYFDPIWSPDSKKILYNDAHLNLWVLDLETKRVEKVDDDYLGSHTGRAYNYFQSSWSPDSKWIAYLKTLPSGVNTIRLYSLDSKESHAVTDGMSTVYNPVFTRDGKYLAFSASTDVGLSNSGLHMTAYDRSPSFHPYIFILSSETPTIFTHQSDEEEIKEDEGTAKEKEEENGEENNKSAPIQVDFNQVDRRIISLPIPAGSMGFNGLVADNLLYSRGGNIYKFDFTKRKEELFIEKARQFSISQDGKHILYRKDSQYFIAKTGEKPKPNDGKIDLGGIKLRVDPEQEWNQIFNEVWAMQKDLFYVENMHGADWEAVKAKYEPFLPHVNHRSDLSYLLNEMLGELVVGHSYIYPGDEPSAPSVSTGLLGADFQIEKDKYRIQKIYTSLDWNPGFNAPLAVPGKAIQEGMYVLAVNGVEVNGSTDLFRLLDFTVGKQVSLKIGKDGDLSRAEDVVVTPISFEDEMALRRQDWVESNRKKVDELSEGEIAYVYMPNTAREGYSSFNRYYFSQMDKKALLLDERNNGGGSVADYVIDLLSRELISGWSIRDGRSFTTPGNGIFGPKAMIINENAGSGGDMMPYMFRFKGLGKLVGRTTMGILVGISGYPPLIDGGRVTSPNFGVFDLNGNYIIENEGVQPDLFVEQLPKALLQGKDPQLEATVELLKEEMKRYPYKELRKPVDPNRVN